MSEIVISTENLHKFYGSRDQKVHALRGIDLSIEEGDLPIAEAVADRIISLPIYPQIDTKLLSEKLFKLLATY